PKDNPPSTSRSPPILHHGTRNTNQLSRITHQSSMNKLLGLPPLASQHGQDVDNLIIYVHWLMIVLFVGWLAYFTYALFRFHRSRNPKADYVGVQNHASHYIDGPVALVAGLLLLGLAAPLSHKEFDTVTYTRIAP